MSGMSIVDEEKAELTKALAAVKKMADDRMDESDEFRRALEDLVTECRAPRKDRRGIVETEQAYARALGRAEQLLVDWYRTHR